MNLRGFLLIAAAGLLINLDLSASAQTWMQTSAPSNYWSSIASSADGSKLFALTANRIFRSTNSGADWVSNSLPGAPGWMWIASSANGSNVAVAATGSGSGLIIISTNAGATWTYPGFFFSNIIDWGPVTMSADGTKLIASVNSHGTIGPVWISTNSGASWAQNALSASGLYGVAMTPDGNTMVVAGRLGRIYVSTNAGATWTTNNIGASPTYPCVVVSADGSKLIVGSGQAGGAFFVSTNSGGNWISNAIIQNWTSMASSADGKSFIAGGTSALYSSTDSGITWVSNSLAKVLGVASSADGTKWAAVQYPGFIYTSQTLPTPQLTLAGSNNNLNFSWIVPSTNFVLQQSSNFIDWITLTNSPSLNLTNLCSEVSLSLTNDRGFFRLVAQ